jgi:hypothetical protein
VLHLKYMTCLKKALHFFLFFSFLFCYKSLALNKPVFAQVIPTPEPVPTCSTGGQTDEWHSLRPYPFDPCNPNAENLAPYCANSIIAWDQISNTYNIGYYAGTESDPCNPVGKIRDCDCGGWQDDVCCNQVLDSSGHWTTGLLECVYNVSGERHISASFENAELPIMGNTVNVVHNHVGADDAGFNDAAKVNEYVSWYLNGVIGRAEYPYPDLTQSGPTSMENPNDVDKIINFSGPIKKLLPFSIQNQDRNKQINDLSSNTVRHNQLVACTHLGLTQIVLPFIGTVSWPSFATPIECYGSLFNLANRKNLDEWDGRTPPIEEDPQYLYHDQIEFLKAYTEWRGYICIFLKIPLINRTVFYCFNNPLGEIHWWSNLFSYIPFSSTEDRVGDVHIKSVIVNESSPDFVLKNVTVSENDAELYFPHMQESTELASLLQKTYASKDVNLTGQASRVNSSSNPYCDLTEVRSNPGDPISDPDNPAQLEVDINYDAEIYCKYYAGTGNFNGAFCETSTTADPPGIGGECASIKKTDNIIRSCIYYSKLDCDPNTSNTCYLNSTCQEPPTDIQNNCLNLYGGKCMPLNWHGCIFYPEEDTPLCSPNSYYGCANLASCDTNPPYETNPDQQCTKTLNVNVQPETETPLANEVWSQLVAGPAGVFKKIFPQVGENSPVESSWDMPGSSTYTFECTSGGACSVGAPSGSRSTDELYFPHIGGIHEYFLRAIQTALRPKGFGNSILSGDTISSGTCDGNLFEDIGDLPDLSTQGRDAAREALGNLNDYLLSTYKAAEFATGVPCEVLAGIHFIEANNNPDKDLQSGAYLNGKSLLDSAIQAGEELKSKAMGNINSIDTLIAALSRYNGGGNSNCQSSNNCARNHGNVYCSDFNLCDAGNDSACVCSNRFVSGGPSPDTNSCRMADCTSGIYPFPFTYGGSCPAQEGYDDPYVVNYLVSQDMYLLYMLDCTQTPPFIFERPGSFTFALGLYLQIRGVL